MFLDVVLLGVFAARILFLRVCPSIPAYNFRKKLISYTVPSDDSLCNQGCRNRGPGGHACPFGSAPPPFFRCFLRPSCQSADSQSFLLRINHHNLQFMSKSTLITSKRPNHKANYFATSRTRCLMRDCPIKPDGAFGEILMSW